MDIDDICSLIPSAAEAESILSRLGDNDKFETLCNNVCTALEGRGNTQSLLALATVLTYYESTDETVEEIEYAKQAAHLIFTNIVQENKASPRIIILLAANLLVSFITKKEYCTSIKDLIGTGPGVEGY